MLSAALFVLLPFPSLQAAGLPERAPIPQLKENLAGLGEPLPPRGAPVPQPRPDQPPVSGDLPQNPDSVPLPETKPEAPRSHDDQEPDFLPDSRSSRQPNPSGVMPKKELACRQRLTALGVDYEQHPAETDPAGCSIPYPLIVKSLGSEISLRPDARMNCAMAEAAARFAKDVVSPAASKEYGAQLKSVSHASAYVCRPRNGTRRLSEHAFGNALDIASFTLTNDSTVAVEPAPDANDARFLDNVRAAACGPFKTVLGPGSDADHALHFHFDLRQRRGGSTFCQ